MESYHGNYYYPEGIVSLSPFLFQKILNTPLLVILYFSLLFFFLGGGGETLYNLSKNLSFLHSAALFVPQIDNYI